MSNDDKIESVIGELDRLSADLSVMLSRVAALRQTVEFMRRMTDHVPEHSVADAEVPVDQQPEPEAEELAEDVMTEGVLAESEDAANEIPEVECTHECEQDLPADDSSDDVSAETVSSGDDLRKWFTINDRYRFRRELFGNDNIAMTDTINLISAMASLPEVEDYVYSDLEWDRDNEEVKAFMDIVAFRFSKRY